jgi:hypothetical protein
MHRTHVASATFFALFFAQGSKTQKHEQRVKNNKETIKQFRVSSKEHRDPAACASQVAG